MRFRSSVVREKPKSNQHFETISLYNETTGNNLYETISILQKSRL